MFSASLALHIVELSTMGAVNVEAARTLLRHLYSVSTGGAGCVQQPQPSRGPRSVAQIYLGGGGSGKAVVLGSDLTKDPTGAEASGCLAGWEIVEAR